jgi:hypothetical protein
MPWKECFGGGRLESLLEANLGPISKCGRASTCACHDGQLVKNPVGVEKGGAEGEPPVSLEGTHRHMPWLPVFAIALSVQNA